MQRRNLVLSLCAAAIAAVASGAAARFRGQSDLLLLHNDPELEISADHSNEPNLSADDPALSDRARALIRIGEIGIAKDDKEAMTRFFSPDYRFHGPDLGSLTREQLWDYFAACRAAFDNFAVTRQQVFSDGRDYVAARTTFSGVFTRPFTASPIGTIKPNGKTIFYKINNVFRYASDGALLEEWAQYDSRLFLQRLGVNLVAAN